MRNLVLITIVTLVGGPVEQDPVKPEQVSLIQLIARPADFDGKRVQVIGYVTTEHEDQGIFISREHFENGVLANAVEISLAHGQEMPLKNDDYAVVEGVIHAKSPTHHVRFGVAEIDSITRIQPWVLSEKEVAKRKARTGGCLWWW